MKKIIIPVIATLLLGGCEFHDTYETYEVVKQGTDMFVDYIEAKSGDWHISGRVGDPGCYVYQEFIFDEITQNVLDKGAVLVYYIDGDNRDNILPYVFPFDNGNEIIMQNVRYEVEKGILTIVIEWQDFRRYDQSNYDFKVCILQPGSNNVKSSKK